MALAAPSTFQDNLRGSLYMLAGMFGFAVNDTISKSFAGELPVGQFMLVRGMIATVFVFAMASALGQMRPLATILRPMVALRGLGEAFATVFFLIALWNIPFANVSAVMQALPLALTVGAALLFGEAIGWRRIAAVLVGLFGVLIILRPDAGGFDIHALLLLVSVAFCVLRDLVTRYIAGQYPPFFVTLVTALMVTLTGAGIALFEDLQPVTIRHLLLFACSSLFLIAGYYYTVLSMQVGDIGFVSPFRYSVLLFSIAGGAIVYGEIPDAMTLAGAGVVVAAGVYTFHRERMLSRRARSRAKVAV